MNELSFFVPVASNRKLAPVHPKTLKPLGPFVSATYASISVTCPTTCMFRNNGCYAEGGFVGSCGDEEDELREVQALFR